MWDMRYFVEGGSLAVSFVTEANNNKQGMICGRALQFTTAQQMAVVP
jgi:hypothetical protein